LGPDPPPWEKHKIYRKLTIFNDFGAFNRAGKSVSKIGIYALPPLKSEFYGFWDEIFNLSRPITELCSLYVYCFGSVFLFHLKSDEKPNSFSVSRFVVCRIFCLLLLSGSSHRQTIQERKNSPPPKKGRLRRSSRQFIATETTMGLIYHYPIDQAKT
jgi:hypothetical protein